MERLFYVDCREDMKVVNDFIGTKGRIISVSMVGSDCVVAASDGVDVDNKELLARYEWALESRERQRKIDSDMVGFSEIMAKGDIQLLEEFYRKT